MLASPIERATCPFASLSSISRHSAGARPMACRTARKVCGSRLVVPSAKEKNWAENITKNWVNTTTLHADPFRVPCHPCHRLHDDISTCKPSADNPNVAACMADISVESILKAVNDGWSRRSNVVKMRAA